MQLQYVGEHDVIIVLTNIAQVEEALPEIRHCVIFPGKIISSLL